jgi:hypothetical protein
MNRRKQLEKWGGIALAALCVFLVFRLVKEIMGHPVANAAPETNVSSAAAQQSQPAAAAKKKGTGSPASGSSMQLQELDEYVAKPFPDLSRDPFDFGAPPLTPAQKAMQAARGAGGAMTASSGPPPMQISLRAIGYSDRPYGPEAYLADAQDVFIVHDGDFVSRRYKVLRITSNIVEVQDGTTGEKAQLPIPQVQ